MAHTLSARKTARQDERRKIRNKAILSSVKTQVRKILAMIGEKKTSEATQELRKTYKILDQAVAKGVLHRNNAARQKSHLSRKVAAVAPPAAKS